ncbi:MAG: 3-oxoacyl-ACP synthase [Bacteroidetes bacterium]|nr:3-oxoacyl-ACP synthase [Bacteroidota bacterium]
MEKMITAYTYFGDGKVVVNKQLIFYQEKIATFAEFIKALYKQEQISYPKFYKMDSLSKLGFMCSELLLRHEKPGRFKPGSLAVVLANSSSSLETDLIYQDSIRNRSAYFPSPSVFVYTLANIVIGEICIRHSLKGENAFLVSEKFNPRQLLDHVSDLLDNNRAGACLCGWVEILGNSFRAMVALVEKENEQAPKTNFGSMPFNEASLNELMNLTEKSIWKN